MKAGLVVGFIESTQSPDYIHCSIRREILVSRIGCAKIEFGRFDEHDLYVSNVHDYVTHME